MNSKNYSFKSKIWLYSGNSAWHFVSVPVAMSRKIKNMYGSMSGGFGSLPVTVTVGKTVWRTSIFWDGKAGIYMLPLKSDARKKANLVEGKLVSFILEIRV